MGKKPYASTKLQYLAVITLMLTGILSASLVGFDTAKPSCYALLWLLPAGFSLCCILAYRFSDLLFTRISVTIIIGLCWIRMVVLPLVMVLGNYAVVPENTSWQDYLDKAILLECYELMTVFSAIFFYSNRLRQTKLSELDIGSVHTHTHTHTRARRFRCSGPFLLVFGIILFFFAWMAIRWPEMIPSKFILITAKYDPNIQISQRALDGSGDGPLGILVTLWVHLIRILQMIVPALFLTRLINKKEKRPFAMNFILLGLLLLATFAITTEYRGNSVMAAAALMFTAMSYADKKMLRLLRLTLPLIVVVAAILLAKKSNVQSDSFLCDLSKMMTAYFQGPQNVAACVQVVKENGVYPASLFKDLMWHVPYFGKPFENTSFYLNTPDSNKIFNLALFAFPGRTDQNIPMIGQGYLFFGMFFAPVLSIGTTLLCLWLERRGRAARHPILRNIFFVETIFASMMLVCNNFHAIAATLWYMALAVFIAVPLCMRWSYLEKRTTIGSI